MKYYCSKLDHCRRWNPQTNEDFRYGFCTNHARHSNRWCGGYVVVYLNAKEAVAKFLGKRKSEE